MVYIVGDTVAETSAIEPFDIGPDSIETDYKVSYSTVLSSDSSVKSFVSVVGSDISVSTLSELDAGTYTMKLVGALLKADDTATGVSVS
jgi:hypothetical protein